MSAPDTTVYQFNFKDNMTGNLHNIYATNGQEAIELLEVFEQDILPKLYDVQVKIAATTAVATTPAPAPAQAAPSSTPVAAATPPAAAAGAAPAGDAPLCEHGVPAKLVPAGIAKASGKPYRAFYACSQPRETQCNFKASV